MVNCVKLLRRWYRELKLFQFGNAGREPNYVKTWVKQTVKKRRKSWWQPCCLTKHKESQVCVLRIAEWGHSAWAKSRKRRDFSLLPLSPYHSNGYWDAALGFHHLLVARGKHMQNSAEFPVRHGVLFPFAMALEPFSTWEIVLTCFFWTEFNNELLPKPWSFWPCAHETALSNAKHKKVALGPVCFSP